MKISKVRLHAAVCGWLHGLVGCNTLLSGRNLLLFQKNVLPPSALSHTLEI
jgi:hypothetical protein